MSFAGMWHKKWLISLINLTNDGVQTKKHSDRKYHQDVPHVISAAANITKKLKKSIFNREEQSASFTFFFKLIY